MHLGAQFGEIVHHGKEVTKPGALRQLYLQVREQNDNHLYAGSRERERVSDERLCTGSRESDDPFSVLLTPETRERCHPQLKRVFPPRSRDPYLGMSTEFSPC